MNSVELALVRVRAAAGAEEQGEEDLAYASELMRRHGTLAATLERAREYGAAARLALAPFRAGPERSALVEVIDFCIERGY